MGGRKMSEKEMIKSIREAMVWIFAGFLLGVSFSGMVISMMGVMLK